MLANLLFLRLGSVAPSRLKTLLHILESQRSPGDLVSLSCFWPVLNVSVMCFLLWRHRSRSSWAAHGSWVLLLLIPPSHVQGIFVHSGTVVLHVCSERTYSSPNAQVRTLRSVSRPVFMKTQLTGPGLAALHTNSWGSFHVWGIMEFYCIIRIFKQVCV